MWGSEVQKRQFGLLYPLFYGNQEERNYAKGILNVKRLAGEGYVPALHALGIAYFDHLGVRRDYSESFRFHMEAALKGYPSAECAVGNFYSMAFPRHRACELDPSKAVEWYIRSAEHGNASAQCNLAQCYLTGLGAEKNPFEAYIWATLAMHCSSIRSRSAEVFRDQAAILLNDADRERAAHRIAELKEHLPLAYSEHLLYWRKLRENAESFR